MLRQQAIDEAEQMRNKVSYARLPYHAHLRFFAPCGTGGHFNELAEICSFLPGMVMHLVPSQLTLYHHWTSIYIRLIEVAGCC